MQSLGNQVWRNRCRLLHQHLVSIWNHKRNKEIDNVKGLWSYFGPQGSWNKSHVHSLHIQCQLIGSWSTSMAWMAMKFQANHQYKRLVTVSENAQSESQKSNHVFRKPYTPFRSVNPSNFLCWINFGCHWWLILFPNAVMNVLHLLQIAFLTGFPSIATVAKTPW